MKKIIKVVGAVSIIGMLGLAPRGSVSAYTTDSITNWPTITAPDEPTVSILMNQPIVGDNNLDQIEGLPSSTSFYKPISINVSGVKSYYISTFLDCSSLSGTDKTKCEAGNLLTSSGDTLASVASTKTFSTMSNEWGFRYNIGNSAADPSDKYFAPLPTDKTLGYLQYNGVEQIKTNTSIYSDNKTLTLGFGAKIDGDTAAGTYNGKVTVAVVASPVEMHWSDITYMQQMTSGICKAIRIGSEGSLQDTRDRKIYKVARLKDGNCWMIQNLALDSGTTEATRRQINSSSSDLASGTTYMLPVSSMDGFTADSAQNMYNGTHVDNKYDNNSKNSNGSSDGLGDNTGAYYSWLIATAGSGATAIANDNAPYSICPKGWQLPSAWTSGSHLSVLLTAYDNNDTGRLSDAWHPGYAGYINDNLINAEGNNVKFWSRTVPNSVKVGGEAGLYLNFTPASNNVLISGLKSYVGLPVRCVAR